MGRIRDLITEFWARHDGKKHAPRDLSKAAREITGVTGNMFSNGWEHVAEDGQAYIDSFNRRIPPSLCVSERDRTRANLAIPLPER